MSVIAQHCEYDALPELKGARVLMTGLTSGAGFDIARSFADHGARLILQTPEDSPEMTELAAVLAENASDIRLFNDALASEAEALFLVQRAVQAYGGLDAVVNFVTLDQRAIDRVETSGDVEAVVSDTLRVALRLTEAAANRMGLVWIEGSILNVVRMPDVCGGRAMMLADVLRAELADLTRGLATHWAEKGVRINAVAPPSSFASLAGTQAASEADLAAIAVQLASRKGRSVSGHVLDAEGASHRWC